MAFKNLVERYEAKMAELYAGSARQKADGGMTLDPIIEKKPGVENTNYGEDDRKTPFRSIATDINRMVIWSKSPKGLQWYLDQAVLQTGNVFGDTRIYNPAFVIGNAQPFIHLKRPFADASGIVPSGDDRPASDAKLGSSGRLQLETANRVRGLVISGQTKNAYSQILKWLPPVLVATAASSLFNIIKVGTLGVNERPELDIAGDKSNQYYSIHMWKGNDKATSSIDRLDQVSSNLRRGDLIGAVSALTAPVTEEERKSDTPKSYFLLDDKNVQRYIQSSVDELGKATLNIGQTTVVPQSSIQTSPPETLEDVIASYGTSQVDDLPPLTIPTFEFTSIVDKMSFPKKSLEYVYTSNDPIDKSRLQFIRDSLPKQKTYWNKSFSPSKEETVTILPVPAGFDGGVKYLTNEGDVFVDANPAIKYRLTVGSRGGRRRYFFDNMNSADFAPKQMSLSDTEITSTTIKNYRNLVPTLVDLYFFDFVNKVSIPFRAYVSRLSETVSPEYKDYFYIGRTERNIVYVGSRRSVSFVLAIHAFNEDELITVWRKINYLTGLCYPSGYVNGFMTPPLVKLTLGDVYNNQPGYIRTLTTSIEDDVPWETIEGLQVPHGVTMAITYEIIEKRQPSVSDYNPIVDTQDKFAFYNFARNRNFVATPQTETTSQPTDEPIKENRSNNPPNNQEILNSEINLMARGL